MIGQCDWGSDFCFCWPFEANAKVFGATDQPIHLRKIGFAELPLGASRKQAGRELLASGWNRIWQMSGLSGFFMFWICLVDWKQQKGQTYLTSIS